tara:strand:+ start:3642 stop:3860 length:219 start_codon:yes stop_codon:yes gene_type:complete
VVSQAISDAYLEDLKQKKSVLEWINSPDFDTVCDLASLDTSKMKKNIIEILSMKPALAKMKGRLLKHLLERE